MFQNIGPLSFLQFAGALTEACKSYVNVGKNLYSKSFKE